jgi:hypothetical protein
VDAASLQLAANKKNTASKQFLVMLLLTPTLVARTLYRFVGIHDIIDARSQSGVLIEGQSERPFHSQMPIETRALGLSVEAGIGPATPPAGAARFFAY